MPHLQPHPAGPQLRAGDGGQPASRRWTARRSAASPLIGVRSPQRKSPSRKTPPNTERRAKKPADVTRLHHPTSQRSGRRGSAAGSGRCRNASCSPRAAFLRPTHPEHRGNKDSESRGDGASATAFPGRTRPARSPPTCFSSAGRTGGSGAARAGCPRREPTEGREKEKRTRREGRGGPRGGDTPRPGPPPHLG